MATSRFHRILWSSTYTALLSYAIYMAVFLGDIFLEHPTVSSMVSSSEPVNQLPFPAVAICSINKVSKKRAHDFAKHMANLTGYNLDKLMGYMKFFGQLHDYDFDPSTVTDLLEFQNLLDVNEISTLDILRNLSVSCDELLWKCFWKNEQLDCSSVFTVELTYQGFCCVFNYVVGVDSDPKTTDAGVENGLYVSVVNDPDDYLYTILSTPGIMSFVFSPTDYPDKYAGGLNEILTKPNSENFIEIVPTVLTTVKEVLSYPVSKRECVLDNERKTLFSGDYSFSECNVDCRAKSVYAMCSCIPWTVPFTDKDNMCTISDIPCLNKYRAKWYSYYPEEKVDLYLAKEKHDSLRCENRCYPRCEQIVYDVQINSFPIFKKQELQENSTRLYFYYCDRFTVVYLQDVTYYWFEILSNFGGIFSIFLGWSVISLLRMVLHYSRRIIELFISNFDD